MRKAKERKDTVPGGQNWKFKYTIKEEKQKEKKRQKIAFF